MIFLSLNSRQTCAAKEQMFWCFLGVRQASSLCRGMMLEISALRAQVARLEQEKKTLKEGLSLKFKERYDPLVRHLFSTCVQLKVRKPDGHHAKTGLNRFRLELFKMDQ